MTAKPPTPLDKATVPRVRRRMVSIVWVFIGILGCVIAFAYYSIRLLDGARAYVGGEAQWSKARHESLDYLAQYMRSGNPNAWIVYQRELQVILGDRAARIELDKKQPDYALVRQGFEQGRNHPADVPEMIHLYRHFRWVPEIRQAVDAWQQADRLIDQIRALADRFHVQVQQRQVLDGSDLAAQLAAVESLARRIAPLENSFSVSLSVAARQTGSALFAALLFLSLALVTAAGLFARRMVQHNERGHLLLARGEQQLRSMIKVAPMPLAIVRTADTTFIYANDRALAQFKVKAKDLGKHLPRDLYYRPSDRDRFWSTMLLDGRVHDFELELQTSEGEPFWALMSAERVVYGGEDCVLIATSDIDERKRAQDALRYRAFHDELTGLPNRAMFMDSLKRTMSRLDRKHASCSVLFIDLDHFKEINDTWGHAAGDLLLQQVARRIRFAVREGDLVARLGGDEFVVLIEEATAASELSGIAENLIASLQRPYALAGEVQVQVTSSIGISSYPKDGRDLDSLIQHADSAMYRAKAQGRNNYQFSDFAGLD